MQLYHLFYFWQLRLPARIFWIKRIAGGRQTFFDEIKIPKNTGG